MRCIRHCLAGLLIPFVFLRRGIGIEETPVGKTPVGQMVMRFRKQGDMKIALRKIPLEI